MIVSELIYLGDNTSGLGALGFSASSFVIQLITFILAYLVLRKWAFGPILKVLKERRDRIAAGVSLGEAMEKEKTELEARVAKDIAAARVKADAIISEASETARDALRAKEAEAEKRAGVIVDEAREQTKQEMARAKRQLEGEIVGLIADATEVIAGEKVDPKKDAKLIDKALAGSTR